MSSYMCPDCGERVDEELSLPDGSCNWCNDEDNQQTTTIIQTMLLGEL